MKQIKTTDAVGHVLCHDITRIVKDVVKDAAFLKGHVVEEKDIPVLLSLGKEHLYVWEKQPGMLHENDAAEILYDICAGNCAVLGKSEVREGRINITAKTDGLFTVDVNRLREINSLGEMMIATRPGGFAVKQGDRLAGTRVIPLVIHEDKMKAAKEIGADKPILSILPFKPKRTGIIATGNEIASGMIEDAFTPVLIEKIAEYGCEAVWLERPGDDGEKITGAILDMLEKGAELVLVSGGMSVDPDDRSPLAIKNAGCELVTYGAPVLPGAMFLLSYAKGGIPVAGLPGCVMYSKRTVFDLVLPKIMADVKITPDELASLGYGGLCLGCENCTFPNCGFGKGA